MYFSSKIVEGEDFKCFYCSEKDEKKHCNDFIPSSEFMIPCGDKYKSCIQTYGSFNDFSGMSKSISIKDDDEIKIIFVYR